MDTEIGGKESRVMEMADSRWSTVIDSKIRPFSINLRELWQYRDLIRLLVYRDYVSYFKQTILGPTWWIFQPVVSCMAFVIVFSVIARVSTDNLPPAMFYLSGLTIWFYFSNTLTNCADIFTTNGRIFGKVYFPRIAVPIAIAITNIIKLLFQLGFYYICFAGFSLAGYHMSTNWTIIFLPLLVIYTGALAVSFGLIFASMTCKYRDISLILPFIIQMWMFMSAIMIPMSAVPQDYLFLLAWNPVIHVVELFRYMTLGYGTFHVAGILYSFGVLAVAGLVGLYFFSKAEKNCMDTI